MTTITLTINPGGGVCEILLIDLNNRRKRQLPSVSQPGSSGANSVNLLQVNGAVQADPHFSGANGVQFDFNGMADGVYAMFVAPQYQVNMLLAADGPEARFVTGVGVVFRNVTLRFGTHWFNEQFVQHVDEQLAPHGAKVKHSGRRIVLELCRGHRVEISQLYADKTLRPWLVHGDGSVFHYLNIDIRTPHCDDSFEGALGQTYKCKYVEQREQFAFDRATEESFRVTSLAAVSRLFDANAPCGPQRVGGTPMVGGSS